MGDHVHFVGPGRMGLGLGYALWQTDAVASLAYFGRRPEAPTHPLFTQSVAAYSFGLEGVHLSPTIVILSVPDDALAGVAELVAAQGPAPERCAAFHLSGALSTEVLAPLHARGYAVGSLHPLQTVANAITGADRLPGSYFSVAGEPGAVAAARRLLGALGSPAITVPERARPVYHAAAVMASGYLATLLAAAGRLMVQAGVPEDEALPALLPLARGTLSALEESELGRAITGPLVRGDVETIGLHMRSLEPRERALYAALGMELASLIEGTDFDDDSLSEIRTLMENES